MKKIYITAGLLLLGITASAQVLSNGQVKQDLLKTNYFLDASNFKTQADTSVGKLLGFPQTDLTKFAFKLGVIEDEVVASGFDGVIVYNTATGQTGTNLNTQGIQVNVTPGFYYFSNPNGATTQSVAQGKWVRLGSENVDQLWAQRNNNGVTETYLKPADANGDKYMYSPKRNYINLGNTSFDLVGPDGLAYNNIKKDTPSLLMINASALPTGETAVGPFGKRYSLFSRDIYTIDNTFTPASGTELTKYRGKDIWMLAKGLTHNVGYIIGQNIGNDFMSSTKASNLIGIRSYSTLGDINGTYTPEVSRNVGTQNFPAIYSGKVNRLIGTLNTPSVYGGIVDYIYGVHNVIESSSLHRGFTTTHANRNLKDVVGVITEVTNQPNSTTERLFGSLAYTNYKENSIVNQAFGFSNSAYIQAGSTIGSYTGFNTYIDGRGVSNVTDLYAFKSENRFTSDFTASNMYGLYLADVKKGSQKNFAIYANAGQIRFGDLKGTGDRMVVADQDGVLKTSQFIMKATDTTDGCSEANKGAIHYKEIDKGGKMVGVFGFCTRDAQGNYKWAYNVGGNNAFDGTGAFGSGL